MDEYFERNKKLVEEGAKTSTGEPVKLITDDPILYQRFCQVENSFYKKIPAQLNLNGIIVNNEFHPNISKAWQEDIRYLIEQGANDDNDQIYYHLN